jgi:glycosyltransferase involved in cell wall biosynthesis
MYPEKRLDFILEICQRVKIEIPEFNMIFIGSGIESDKVLEASNKNYWIHYVGPKFGKDRVKYFKISSIQIMPGLVGLGILDSFALETPIITTEYPFHSPEIEYLENGINGFITKDNLDDYSQTVIDTLKTKKYIDLIKGCKLSAEIYTVETMVENFKNGVLSCLSY